MYSAMIFSVVSERLRLMRSLIRDMTAADSPAKTMELPAAALESPVTRGEARKEAEKDTGFIETERLHIPAIGGSNF